MSLPTQPITLADGQTADETGRATFVFPAPAQGQTFTGSVSIPEAPVTSTQSAEMAGTKWGTWQGPGTYGPIQAVGQQVLTVSAANLLPGVQYVCQWIGTSQSSSNASPVSPAATPQPVLNYGQVIFSIVGHVAGVAELLAAGAYAAIDPTVPTWGKIFESGPAMLQADIQTFDLPADSVALVLAQVSPSSGSPVSPFDFGLEIASIAAATGFALSLDGTALGSTISGVGIPGMMATVIDSLVDPSFQFTTGSVDNVAYDNALVAFVLAFAHP